MDLKPTKPLSGFLELTPAAQRFFDDTVRKMQEIAALAGFQFIDLPAIERAEVLTDETDWEDTKTEMYLFQKGDTKMGLRYDGTVGLARYTAGHLNDLDFPCRLTQCSKRWRGERAQKGRYREFYQMDFDILGQGGLSDNYDAEVVALLSKIYNALPEVFGDYEINIGSRRFWNDFAKDNGIDSDTALKLFAIIDKKEKMPAAEFNAGLKEIAGDAAAKKVVSILDGGDAPGELRGFMDLLAAAGVSKARANLATMRGLGYYDGIVYEAKSLTYPEIGSIGAGGRYGNLVGKFTKTQIIGSGAAIGITRAIVSAIESGRIDLSKYESAVDAVILPMGQAQIPAALKAADELRAAGIITTAFLDADKKFKNQIEYADKIKARFAVIIGEDEARLGKVALKNMASGEQAVVSVEEASGIIRKK
ncbi:MAG: histidine--tRNA ligase [Rickettsiales bacterium]|jgi:histidyl-tRNA synthetase|nr:histidine--tRNA ligase [Rickettsiales bacterium]